MKFFLLVLLFFAFLKADELDSFELEFKTPSSFDPLSGYNRVMTNINDKIYRNILNPVFKGYNYVLPKEARHVVSNFFNNLFYPVRFVNNILQLKFKNAGEESLRFVANTIIGFGGISDPATTVYGLEMHDEDFGQTLGYWGVGSGLPIVLPILGQSNLRDVMGMGVDYFLSPTSYINRWYSDGNELVNFATRSVMEINKGSDDFDTYDRVTKDAIDIYPLIKNLYEQRRDKLIKE